MSKMRAYFRDNPLSYMLLFIPAALIAEWVGWSPLLVFIFSALAVVPLAGMIGTATEALAAYTGPRVGGLLNATLGNAAELIITLVAIREGFLDLVKASITGSILGNLLLVMGAAMVFGGVRHGLQRFDRRSASNHAILLILAVMALVIPSIFSHSMGPETSVTVEALSLSVAAVMIILYALGLLYNLRSAESPVTHPSTESINHHKPSLTVRQSFLLLAISTIGVVFMSELLVGATEHVVESLGLSEFFLGIILIPIVGNVAEHVVAVQVAMRNQMDLSVEIAVSSSVQVALFVAPLLVFVSLLMGHPLTLIFNTFELLAVGSACIIAALVAIDGESHWLEGAALLAVYIILAVAFFLLPA
ncbi:MAG TPA: calcium/proton exchanger [Anaerolineaceae bacterium]